MQRVRAWLCVLALHLCATFVLTFPAVPRIADGLFGTVRGDKYQFIWIFWWVKRSLVELGQLPFWTSLQYHPTGVSLALHDMSYFWSLLSVPLQLLLSPATILNVFLLASIPLNGLAFYALASYVARSHWGALAGSVVFAYCPYLLGRFVVSHPQYLGAFFVPLFLLRLYRYSEAGRLRDLVWAGAFAGLTALITFYYAIGLAFVFAAFLVHDGLVRRAGLGTGPRLYRLGGQLAAIGVPALVLTLPVLLPALLEVWSGAFGDRIGGSSLERASVDLTAYFVPDRGLVEWRGWAWIPGVDAWVDRWTSGLPGNVEERSVYPGWLGWCAALAALGSPRLRREAWPWLGLALSALVLTLGPTLHVGGATALDGWMPARWLQSMPLLNIVRGPSRFAVFVALGLGMVVALGVAEVGRRKGPGWARAAALGCLAFTFLEFAPRPIRVFDRTDGLSPFYSVMAADGEAYAVLNVPVDFRGAVGGGDLYSYAQTVHGKPIVGGYVSREPKYVFETLRESPFLQAVQHRQYWEDRRLALSPGALADMAESLERLDVRYMLVHRTELPKDEWRRVTRWLEQGPVKRVYQDSQLRAYEVVPRP